MRPDLAGIVIGGAPGGLDEYREARRSAGAHVVLAVNKIAALFEGPLLALATLHAEKVGTWLAERQGPPPAYVISPTWHSRHGRVDYELPDRWGGSSGLYAVQVAIEVFDLPRIILCGVPLDGAKGHIDGREYWDFAEDYRRGFQRAMPFIADRVRSMSGWTSTLLGTPRTHPFANK